MISVSCKPSRDAIKSDTKYFIIASPNFVSNVWNILFEVAINEVSSKLNSPNQANHQNSWKMKKKTKQKKWSDSYV